ncbi:MAG TPA: ATP-binding protein [Ignavibacteriaceae bacterium]|nr:ATP-binding protein [Ignavibacteriaceae bacterium]
MKLPNKFHAVRFEWRHILIIFLTLVIFQVFVTHLQQNTISSLLSDTMDWYKQNSAEQIGNLSTTSLELLLGSESLEEHEDQATRERNLIHALNSILKQPLMKRNVEEMCVILPYNDKFIAMDLGQSVYSYFYNHRLSDTMSNPIYKEAVARYSGIHNSMINSELITSFEEAQNIFHVYIPLVPHGEYSGAVYLKIHPDLSFISQQMLSSFNKTAIFFSSLILLGLLAMLYISTYTLRERDKARELLFAERELHLREHIAQKKEHLFTKRIYHTHHKAEKVMGFISEDLERADEKNIKEIKYRVSKYANFIARVIYDMKWYNPPLQTIRNQIFNTNLNEVLRFIVNNIFLRIAYQVKTIKFNFNLDQNLPCIPVNEFVVWEIIEPIIQNAIEHSDKDIILISISSLYYPDNKYSTLIIEDNGKGIRPDLLEKNEFGIKRIFLENISTKPEDKQCGYGCYLAYEISKRCGWEIDAVNKEEGGCRIILTIKHT